MKKYISLFIVFLFQFFLQSTLILADDKPDLLTSKISGFVFSEAFYNSRQIVSSREGQFYLFPANQNLDKNNNDINAKSDFNLLSIRSRVALSVTGPEVLDAKTTGYIETEFFGSTDANENTLRLRHAFIKLSWDKTNILIGQAWHPMFVADCAPGTVNFNTGAPFQPFIRSPQIRVTQNFGDFSILGAILSQRDFSSFGPSTNSPTSDYIRNAVIPELDIQLIYKTDAMMLGIGGDYKTLLPKLTNFNGTASENSIKSIAGIAYGKYMSGDFKLKLEGVYGQNLAEMQMIGGYAFKSPVDSVMNEYTNINCFSAWTDISYGKEWEVGLFAGYEKNLGSDSQVNNNKDLVFIRGLSTINGKNYYIDNMYRISPRIQWTSGKFRTSFELDLTTACYGTIDYTNFKVSNTTAISNIRCLLAFCLFF